MVSLSSRSASPGLPLTTTSPPSKPWLHSHLTALRPRTVPYCYYILLPRRKPQPCSSPQSHPSPSPSTTMVPRISLKLGAVLMSPLSLTCRILTKRNDAAWHVHHLTCGFMCTIAGVELLSAVLFSPLPVCTIADVRRATCILCSHVTTDRSSCPL